MKARHRSDIISTLHESIINRILAFVPMRDAVRTSILSKRWRHSWVNIPNLVFDDKLFGKSTKDAWLSNNYKVLCVIHQVLLHHQGPIVDFTLCIGKEVGPSYIDHILLYLSKTNTVEKLRLQVGSYGYTLPSSFFSLQHLTHVYLAECTFQPPSTFDGFARLTSLYLEFVKITADVLQDVISNCPLLKSFTLIGNGGEFPNSDGPTFELGHRTLSLDLLRFTENQSSLALVLMQSFPNLKQIKILLDRASDPVEEIPMAFSELPHDFSLDHLEELEIGYFYNLEPEVEFLKLILANSSMLKKVFVEYYIDSDEDVEMLEKEVMILKELIQLPRASPMMEFVIKNMNVAK